RLETTRQRILSKSGESIPVNLSAAILYDDGIEIGTVGIFTDLRERLKVAEKLRAAEEELRERERHKLTIELAGAAAHELNQPLTSIVGYSDILSRRLPEDERLHRAVNIIVQESTRMAEIVKRLGKLTTRKTKEYIGETSILHLNRGLPLETGLDRGEEEPYE
ncbi:MAG: histidine kinase dimerization/phospho-acceptor domain-containing protein, partial [Myxococcota bacterium]|nr:histidine kinase dimerization/phospho-acceptor domain-containing protein [Myxococcota bacterium]